MKYSEICILVLKLIFNLCLPQQKFAELQEQATVFPILKICLHSGNYILIFILCPMYGHLNCLLLLLLIGLFLNLQCGSLQPPFPGNGRIETLCLKSPLLEPIKPWSLIPSKLQWPTVFTLQIQFQYISIVIGFPEIFMYSWLAALLYVCVCLVDEAWFHLSGCRNPWKDNTEVLKIHMFVTRSHCMTIYALN